MLDDLDNLEEKEAIRQSRIYLFSCSTCSIIFYFLMTRLSPAYLDYLPGRIAISVFSFVCLIGTYIKKKNVLSWSNKVLQICTISFILFYLYLLVLNDWSIFHCWSYFVAATILCSISMSWNLYLQYAIIGVGGPLILGFWSRMNWLELLHFHSANFATFAIIGVAVHSTFKYKKEVAKLTNTLIEQSKMAALGEMAGGISHEINNPLAIIKGSVEQLQRIPLQNSDDSEKFVNLSDKVNRMVIRISRITTALKDFSQDSSNEEMAENDLNLIAELAIDLCQTKFKNIETEIKFIPYSGNAICLCKKNQIVQIIHNLCTNAFEAINNPNEPFIEVAIIKIKNQFIISIKDNGIGIAEGNINKIMEPFFTTKEVGKGLGLGLSVSHGFAKNHGGDLYVNKTRGMTSFNLVLPAVIS